MNQLRRWRISLVGLLAGSALLFGHGTVSALDVPSPPSDIPIVDQTNTLTDEQKQELAATIAAERQSTGNQIAILMIPTLSGAVLEDYSLNVARTWGVGTKERDSGVLLLVVKNDHRVRIEVGYGLEGALPDIRAGRIIRDRIAPEFRQDKYFEGLQAGIAGITTAIHGEVDPNLKPERPTAVRPQLPWELLLAALFVVPGWLASILSRTKSWWAGGAIGAAVGASVGLFAGFLFWGLASMVGLGLIGLLFDRAVSRNYQRHAAQGDSPSWWAGGPYIGGFGGNNRNDSGGFGGFGGGGFGGGGADGDW